MTNSVTQRLSEYVAKITFADLPANVIDGTKRLILDDIGCAFGGYVTKAGKILTDFALEIGGRGIATIIGSGTKVSCTLASGINAQMANILDFDETWKIGHPGSSIVQAGVAVGEHLGSNGKDVINAIVAGYEISTRIGEGVWHGRGLITNVRPLSWHVFGPAIVAAKLLNLDPQKINHTMGIAGGIAPMMNIKRLIDRPSNMIKAGNHWWCEAGINAAFLAGRGFKGIPDLLDGEGATGLWSQIAVIGKL